MIAIILFYLLIWQGQSVDYEDHFETSITGTVSLRLLEPGVMENSKICSTIDGCLSLQNISTNNGSDQLGNFQIISSHFVTSSETPVLLSSRLYDDNTIIYQQIFPEGLNGTSMNDTNGLSTAWPVFQIPEDDIDNLRYITPGSFMVGWGLYSQGINFHDRVKDELHKFRDGENGGLVVLVSESNKLLPNVIMSAIEEPMSVNVQINRTTKVLSWGVQGMVNNIPAGYSIQIVTRRHDSSINKNIVEWGTIQQRFHNTKKLEDFTSDYLGYWTDDGAAHYYSSAPFPNFEQLFIHTHNYSVENHIPIRYIQMDSWWYYKGIGDGLKNWTAQLSIFPRGIEYVHNVTGWPIAAHNRYFGIDTDYATQNGGNYRFFLDEVSTKALPLTKEFWDDLFDEAVQWGLSLYEQDWMDRQYEYTSILHTSATQGSTWLNQMGHAAEERNIPIQYCMALIRQVLHSVTLPAVTQVRVSDDYFLAPDQWRIGVSSLFAYALGLKPYKDNFWTSRNNNLSVFVNCERTVSNGDYSLIQKYGTGGRKRTTETGKDCLYWSDFGYDAKYLHSSLRENWCKNPEDTKNGSYCYTKAPIDIPEEKWEWEYCSPPLCDIDCYVLNGSEYNGSYKKTLSGLECVDWKGEFEINGSYCRNPNNEKAPWCYVDESHHIADYCDNSCPLASEPNSYLQSAVSTLSAGPVGISDDFRNLNKDLIMKSVRTDGLILRPSKPLTVIDKYFMQSNPQEIWTTESTISNHTFGIIMAAEIHGITLSSFELNIEASLSTDSIVWMNYPESLSNIKFFEKGYPIVLPSGYSQPYEFYLLYTSPVYSLKSEKVSLLGELSKWTTVSRQRIDSITIADDIIVVVKGIRDENVSLTWWTNGITFNISCLFIVDGNMTMSYTSKSCS